MTFLRDYKNLERIKPRNNPPRQRFNGFLGFNINSEVLSVASGSADHEVRLSSLLRTAEIPSASFQHEVYNQYNRKKVAFSGVEYRPINITVLDTLDSEWLVLLTQYFAHMSNNMQDKFDDNGNPINIPNDAYLGVPTGDGSTTAGGFDSNYMGLKLKPNDQRNFFKTMDIVMYHGGKGVQYTLFNPHIVDFNIDGIDYTSSDPVNINLTIVYENFALRPTVNFDISDEDLARFENYTGEPLGSLVLPPGVENGGRDLAHLKTPSTDEGSE